MLYADKFRFKREESFEFMLLDIFSLSNCGRLTPARISPVLVSVTSTLPLPFKSKEAFSTIF